jgi:predicted transcriptional regulator
MGEGVIEIILTLIEQHSNFLNVVASFAMAMIVYFSHRKMLELAKKDRERPRIVELLRFCILPLKKWLSKISQDELQKFDCEEILRPEVSGFTHLKDSPLPKIFCADFYTLLERLHRRKKWDKKVQKFNALQRDLSQKMEDLKRRLEKFVSESPDIKRIYEESEAKKNYSFEAFKHELTNAHDFYTNYKNAKDYDSRGEKWSLGGAWYFVGKEIFYPLMHNNESFLKEIDELIKNRDDVRDSLVTELDEIQKRLREKYKLSPSEEVPRALAYRLT